MVGNAAKEQWKEIKIANRETYVMVVGCGIWNCLECQEECSMGRQHISVRRFRLRILLPAFALHISCLSIAEGAWLAATRACYTGTENREPWPWKVERHITQKVKYGNVGEGEASCRLLAKRLVDLGFEPSTFWWQTLKVHDLRRSGLTCKSTRTIPELK